MNGIEPPSTALAPWREKLHEIIFEADTPAGKTFDIFLLVAILVSVITVSLETVKELGEQHRQDFLTAEWCLTILFTIEYGLRLLCVRSPLRYAASFFGIVDLLAILPTYLSLVLPGAQSLAVIRSLRFLRAFRVFKLARMLGEASALRKAIWDARGKRSRRGRHPLQILRKQALNPALRFLSCPCPSPSPIHSALWSRRLACLHAASMVSSHPFPKERPGEGQGEGRNGRSTSKTAFVTRSR